MDKKSSVAGGSLQPQHRTIAVCHGYNSLPQECRYSWYWNRKVIENCSPSREDGICLEKESQLRMLYCSFIQDIGMKLGVPQISIATAIMFCHRFYLHQSHGKNEWQTIATVCMFLASKVEDTPCHLNKVVKIAYETMYQRDYVAAQRINKKEVFEKQKSLILVGERLVLCTIRYDFDVRHPYKPLIEACKKLKIGQKDVRQTAWNFVNDWLQTTLCLQYQPNYIAAGSLYLSAKHHKVKLPSGDDGCTWWQVLNIVPCQLDAVLKQMKELLCAKHKQKQVTQLPPKQPKQTETPVVAIAKVETVLSPDSCVSTEDVTLVPESINSNAERSAKDQCETGISKGLNGTVINCLEDVSSILESTTNAKLSTKDQCGTGISEGIDDTVKICMEDVSSVPESTTSNSELSTKNQSEAGNFEGVNGTVRNYMEDMFSIPEFTTSNAKLSTIDQCETGISEGLNGTVKNCMEDVPSIPESAASTSKVNSESQCDTKVSNGVVSTVKSGLEDEVQSALNSLLDMERIKSLMKDRKRKKNVSERAISLESLNDDEWIERELESGIVLTKRPKPCKDLVSF